VKYAYGKWVDEQDLENKARWFVYNYHAGKDARNDGERLAEWEAQYTDEPWRLDAKLQSVLDRDLMNWAKTEKTWKMKTHAVADMDRDRDAIREDRPNKDDPVRPMDTGSAKPRRSRRGTYRNSEPPSGPGVTCDLSNRPVNLGELQRCELTRNGLGPVPGHCMYCDRALGIKVQHGEAAAEAAVPDQLQASFPYLYASVVELLSLAEIADEMGVSVATVKRRIADDKKKAQQTLAA
jgi:hypothetical protein